MQKTIDALESGFPLTNDQIIDAMEEVGANGDLVFIKNDGLRSERRFTVVISPGKINQFDSIRLDGDNLSDTMIFCLRQYLKAVE